MLSRVSQVARKGLMRAFATGFELEGLKVVSNPEPKTKLPNEELTFGTSFADHMFSVDWTEGHGWHDAQIIPHGDLPLNPAAAALHYGMQCFEGMKAYIDSEDQIRMFRPELNMARLNDSMKRLYLPQFDEEGLLGCIKELLKKDKSWIPKGEGYSLYIRPTGISTHGFLGVGPSKEAKIFVITSPVGPYYAAGFKPVKLWAETSYVRAWPGGTGNAKVGGNYGPTIMPAVKAAEKGAQQVLWLFGEEKYITEVGAMNFFVLWENEDGEKELITAPLDGTILPGVTRRSVLELAKSWGEFKVSERSYTMPELAKALDENRVIEAFGTGTAAIVTPVDGIMYDDKEYNVPLDPEKEDAVCGKITQRVWDTIVGIQYGDIEGPEGWSVVV